METLVLVFTGMTSVLLVESCQGDGIQWQVLKIARNTVEVQSVWHDIYVTAETGGQMQAVVYFSVSLRNSDRERARDLRRDAQILPKTAMRKPANDEGRLCCDFCKTERANRHAR
jgi:hypothetical protein